MNYALRRTRMLLSSLRLIPHVLIFLGNKENRLLMGDLSRWAEICLHQKISSGPVRIFVELMTFLPEFRSLFYYRVGLKGKIFSFLCPGLSTLYIAAKKIGPGLFIQHGFSTIIAAKSIGANCWINQQVTIGFTSTSGQPTLQDNVTVNAGAKIIGDITVGSNTKVGANAVVVKDVPANVTAVGVPARIVKRDGNRVDEAL
ncbi:MAG TPA: hypothetical protein VL381_00270 [Rhodocyclaceae bacterium]|nr:hypothetical protein [Rhodocyclaceae bacterium]